MIEPRCYHACVLIGQHVYVTGGYSLLKRKQGEMIAVSSIDRLDLQNKLWKRCADMITARAAHSAVQHGTYLYVFGGRNAEGNVLSSVEFYNSDEDIWVEVSFLPRPAMGLTAVCVKDSIWLLGGITANISDPTKCISTDVFSFTPSTKRWSARESLPHPRAFSVCICDGHSLWLIGGCTFSQSSEQNTLVSCSSVFSLSLSPTLSKWRSIASLLHPRHALTAVLFDETIYVFGGIVSASTCTSNKVEVINTTTKMSMESFEMPASVAGSASVLISLKTRDSLCQSNIKSVKDNSQSSISTDYGASDKKNTIVYRDSDLKKDVPQTYKIPSVEENVSKGYKTSNIEDYVPKSYSSSSIEKDFPENYNASYTEKDILESYSASQIEKDIPQCYSSSNMEKYGTKSYKASSMENIVQKSCSISNIENDNKISISSGIDKNVSENNAVKNASVKYDGNELELKTSDEILVHKMELKDSVDCQSARDFKINESDSFYERKNSRMHLQNIQDETGSNVRYRASMEIFLNSEIPIKEGKLAKKKSSVTEWLKYFESLTPKYFKDVSRSKESDKMESPENGRIMKDSFSVSEKPFNAYFKVPPELKVKLTNQKDNFVSSSLQSSKSACKSLLYIHSNLASQISLTESDIHDFNNISEYEKATELRQDNFSAVHTDSTRISVDQTYLPIILVTGGEDPNGREILSYNFKTDSWYYCGSIPEYRCHHCIIFLNSCLYIIGGFDSQSSRNFKKITGKNICYDFSKEMWLTKANMIYPRAFHAAIIINGEICVLGGRDPFENILTSVEVYNQSQDEWREGEPLPYPVLGAAVISVNGMLYLFGGITYEDKNEVILSRTAIFDPKHKSWSSGPDMPTPLAFCGVSAISNSIWLFGGLEFKNEHLVATDDVFKFDLKEDSWSQVAELSTPRFAAVTVSLDTQVYVIGGFSSQTKEEVEMCEQVDMSKNKISFIKHLPIAIPGKAGAVITSLDDIS